MKGVSKMLSGFRLFARVHSIVRQNQQFPCQESLPPFLTPKQKFFSLETEGEIVWGGEGDRDGGEIKIFPSEVSFPPFTV